MENNDQSLASRVGQLEQKLQERKPKDSWDKLSILATFLSSVIIAGLVALFTIVYQTTEQQRLAQAQQQANSNAAVQNQLLREQNRLRNIEVVSAFIPHLSGKDSTEESRKLAIVAFNELGNASLAAHFAVVTGGEGAKAGLEAILEVGEVTAEDRQVISNALSRLLGHAEAKIDGYVSDFRTSNDSTSGRDELLAAATDLATVSEAAIRQGDKVSAALSLLRMGDVQRYLNNWDAAIENYVNAERLAIETGKTETEFKAVTGKARAYLYGKAAPDTAHELATQAVSLAQDSLSNTHRFNALDLLAQTEIYKGNIEVAISLLDNALELPDIPKKELFYGHLDRADAFQKLAERCDDLPKYEACLGAVDKAEGDYLQSLKIAESLGWTGLAIQTRGFLERLEIRRQLIHLQRKRDGSP